MHGQAASATCGCSGLQTKITKRRISAGDVSTICVEWAADYFGLGLT